MTLPDRFALCLICLLRQYTPTPEIQTTTINNWVYRGSEDVVKVEVGKLVDAARDREISPFGALAVRRESLLLVSR